MSPDYLSWQQNFRQFATSFHLRRRLTTLRSRRRQSVWKDWSRDMKNPCLERLPSWKSVLILFARSARIFMNGCHVWKHGRSKGEYPMKKTKEIMDACGIY